MSTNGTPTPRVYRGRSTAELIPTIQAELGAEAIVLARRSGLEGGIGGFFQRPFVEIEAQPGGSRIDLYDGADATPAPLSAEREPTAEAPSTVGFDAPRLEGEPELAIAETPLPLDDAFASVLAVASAEPLASGCEPQPAQRPAQQFDAQLEARTTTQLDRRPATSPAAADELSEIESILASRVAPEREPEPQAQAPATRSKVALAVAAELQAIGFDEGFAAELIEEASAHVVPFVPRIGLRRAVRVALERRIPVAAPLPGRGAALALVGSGGSGKTKCVAALAAAYRQAGTLPVGCASLCADGSRDGLRMVFSPRVTTPAQASSQRALKAVAAGRAAGLVLIDTPSLSPSQGAEVKQLGRVLAAIAPDRTIAMLPATLGAKAAGQLLTALAPLQTSALAISHADETDQLGVAVQAACTFGLAPEYVLTGAAGAAGARAIERTDAATLAARLIP